MATHIINVKELRASMQEVLKRVRQGDQYTVIYRSRPAFKIVAVDAEEALNVPLENDPLYGAPAVGRSHDGLTAQDHDLSLYGKYSK